MKRRIVSMLLALALLACLAPCALAADDAQRTAARTLYSLGLMKGAGKNADGTPNFALDRAATRAEAVTMLVRLLGVGGEELAKERELPFSDVPDWAAQTVGYAYDAGLTNGVGGGRFGSDSAVTAAQYLTFVLRAMGYTSGTDFSWDAAWALTDRLGVTHGQYRADSTFLRGDAALVSACALRAACKNGKTLYENIFGKALPDELAQSLRTLACEAEARDTSVAAPGYASYLDELDLPAILGQPQYSQAQIRAIRGYTLDQLKDAICTVPDMVQYLVETGYGKAPVWKDDIHFNNGGYDWAVNKSAAGALATSCPSCGAVSNLTRYILEDDYTDTGYVLWGEYDTSTNRASGGHIINFYQIGNEYVTFDYESVIAGQWRPNDTSCWQVSSAPGASPTAPASSICRAVPSTPSCSTAGRIGCTCRWQCSTRRRSRHAILPPPRTAMTPRSSIRTTHGAHPARRLPITRSLTTRSRSRRAASPPGRLTARATSISLPPIFPGCASTTAALPSSRATALVRSKPGRPSPCIWAACARALRSSPCRIPAPEAARSPSGRTARSSAARRLPTPPSISAAARPRGAIF